MRRAAAAPLLQAEVAVVVLGSALLRSPLYEDGHAVGLRRLRRAAQVHVARSARRASVVLPVAQLYTGPMVSAFSTM